MRRLSALLLLLTPSLAVAQDDAAPVVIPTVEQQIATAVLPMPEAFRATATVMGYRTASALEVIRQGEGPMICLADNPVQANFHVACYHESLEPFMARGRELRTMGIRNVDSLRYPEVESGKLPMPNRAALWSMTGAAGSMNFETATPNEPLRALYVVYIPGATPETTGLSAQPGPLPWLMFPGTPKAHIMFVPSM